MICLFLLALLGKSERPRVNVLNARVEVFLMCRERQGSREVNVSMLVHSYHFVVETRFPSI